MTTKSPNPQEGEKTMKAIARLEELLDQKDATISELEDKLQEFEDDSEKDWEWARHRIVEESELPVPRLEIRWYRESDDGYLQRWDYAMIYRHLLGHLIAVPLGQTKTQGSSMKPPIYDGKISTPFRDGAHIRIDSFTMGFPAFAIVEAVIEKLEPQKPSHENFSKKPEARP